MSGYKFNGSPRMLWRFTTLSAVSMLAVYANQMTGILFLTLWNISCFHMRRRIFLLSTTTPGTPQEALI